ncbi:hypothetical protein DCD95_19005, partial [Acinetobacter baumannii]
VRDGRGGVGPAHGGGRGGRTGGDPRDQHAARRARRGTVCHARLSRGLTRGPSVPAGNRLPARPVRLRCIPAARSAGPGALGWS